LWFVLPLSPGGVLLSVYVVLTWISVGTPEIVAMRSLMASTSSNIRRLHEELGIPIDANTDLVVAHAASFAAFRFASRFWAVTAACCRLTSSRFAFTATMSAGLMSAIPRRVTKATGIMPSAMSWRTHEWVTPRSDPASKLDNSVSGILPPGRAQSSQRLEDDS
jgi:hypothetical protein